MTDKEQGGWDIEQVTEGEYNIRIGDMHYYTSDDATPIVHTLLLVLEEIEKLRKVLEKMREK